MVDFQSRDTRRDRGTDEDDEPAEEADADTSETVSEETAENEGHDQVDDDDHSHDQVDDDDHSHDHTHDDSHSHDHHAHDLDTLGMAVVTVSSSRTAENDPSGDAITTLVESAGHEVATREVLDDDYDHVQASVEALAGRGDVDVVVTTGGTGVTPDDVTIEAVSPLFEKELPGFGELFRSLSFDDIGTKIVGTRATAGITNGVVVFCLPGSENAVRLGTENIILEEAGHLAGLARRD